MPYKDPEKRRESDRRRHENNPEKSREAVRRWKENNPDKKREAERMWRENNPDKCRMLRWKGVGVKGDLQAIHDRWEQATNCEVCGVSFEGIKKCMDHDHTSGEFRQILCASCNNKDSWMKKIELN